MSETFNKVVLALVVLAFLPALLAGGGFIVAAVLAVLIVSGMYGGRWGLELVKQRHVGAKQAGMRERVRGRDDKPAPGRDD